MVFAGVFTEHCWSVNLCKQGVGLLNLSKQLIFSYVESETDLIQLIRWDIFTKRKIHIYSNSKLLEHKNITINIIPQSQLKWEQQKKTFNKFQSRLPGSSWIQLILLNVIQWIQHKMGKPPMRYTGTLETVSFACKKCGRSNEFKP